ncbi:MAG: cell division protein FtsZ [Spirochaetia bacterium]|nr:cell division protein FtsZ [Spirochaetia bacterium]
MLAFEDSEKSPAIIKVVGVGGAGMNAVERMVNLKLKGVELICMNTDEQVLNKSSAHIKVHLGSKITRGMGAGANPEVGNQAAIEDRDKILNVLKGADMVFITAGMGGGTGTGASPVVAEVARELKALTVGVISLPFKAEGGHKMQVARKGQSALREKVDTLITIPNDAIFKVIDKTTPINLAFKAIDDVLAKSVIGISDIINSTGHVNVDFADVRTVMSQNGDAVIGTGEGHGENRVSDALQHAIHHPLLEGRSIDGAKAVLINVVGGSDLSMHEFNEIQETIHNVVSENAQIIVGFTEDDSKEDQVSITVIATGFQKEQKNFDSNVQKLSRNGYYDNRMDSSSAGVSRETIRNIDQKKTAVDHAGFPFKDEHPRQQGLNFPNLESDLENLNIPAYLRKNK